MWKKSYFTFPALWYYHLSPSPTRSSKIFILRNLILIVDSFQINRWLCQMNCPKMWQHFFYILSETYINRIGTKVLCSHIRTVYVVFYKKNPNLSFQSNNIIFSPSPTRSSEIFILRKLIITIDWFQIDWWLCQMNCHKMRFNISSIFCPKTAQITLVLRCYVSKFELYILF